MTADTGHVATVAGRRIPLAVVDARLAELRAGRLGRHLPPDGSGGDGLRRWIVQEVVTGAVLLHEAAEAGLASDPVWPVVPPAIVQQLFHRVTSQVAVPGEAVRAYYDRNADRYRSPETRWIRYGIAADEAAARALVDEAPAEGGGRRLGLHRGQWVGPLEDAVFSAHVGDVVGPFQLEPGWVVAQVEAITPEGATPFHDVQSTIEAELVRAARASAFDAWVAARTAALATIVPAYEHPGHPVHGLHHHRH